jgi:two-component system phosphate regulon sensor histidine kinase PhoR
MWASRLFWKLFASYTLLNLIAIGTLVVILSGWQYDQVIDQNRQRLRESAALIRHAVESELAERQVESLQQHVRSLSQQIETRITIVTMDGMVIADSSQESLDQVAELENHRVRLELMQAASNGYGSSQRMSGTLKQAMLYVALRVDRDGGPIGLVRAALPMEKVLTEVATVQRLVWPVAIGVSVAVAMLTWFLSARVVRPVQTLTTAAESITTGDYTQRPFLPNRDELGTLAGSFNRMTQQLKVREAELRESSRRLATVLEGMVEGVIALDTSEHVVLANSAAGRVLNFDPIEAAGRSLLEVVRNRPIHEAIAAATVTTGQQVEVETGEGDSRVIRINGTVLPSGSATRCVLVLHDVTELRKLESLRQEFVANVSHELKTPLSSIKAYSETLLNGALYDEDNNRRFVERIDEQSQRLHELILDLISIAQIESGQQAFEIDSISLADVAAKCITGQQRAADAKRITLACEGIHPNTRVSADREGLRQILNNLVDNAIKYTPDGGTVALSCRQQESEVVIQVRDTGIGIEAEQLPRVFERFYRVDKARSRELGGTGLGLSIVKHLTQSFGGRVDVSSLQGEGTTFTVILPAA